MICHRLAVIFAVELSDLKKGVRLEVYHIVSSLVFWGQVVDYSKGLSKTSRTVCNDCFFEASTIAGDKEYDAQNDKNDCG